MRTPRFNLIAAVIVLMSLAPAANAVPIVVERPAPAIELLDSGAEPRRPIRIRAEVGAEQVAILRTMTTVSQKFGDFEIPEMKSPGVTQSARSRIDNVRLDGELTVTTKVESVLIDEPEPGEDPIVHDAIEEIIGPLRNFTATITMTDRGAITSVSAEAPEFADEELTEFFRNLLRSMSQTSVAYPVEPIGVGARWKVIETDDSFGVPLEIASEFEVVSYDGDTVTIRSTMLGGLQDDKPAPAPGVDEPGVSVVIESMKVTGELNYIQNLRLFMPTRMTLISRADSVSRATLQDMDPIVVESAIKLEMNYESEPAPPQQKRPD